MKTGLGKLRNDYADMLQFDAPKSVFAALAVSHVFNHGGDVNADLAREWVLLHQQGIIPQAPPAAVRALAEKAEDDK